MGNFRAFFEVSGIFTLAFHTLHALASLWIKICNVLANCAHALQMLHPLASLWIKICEIFPGVCSFAVRLWQGWACVWPSIREISSTCPVPDRIYESFKERTFVRTFFRVFSLLAWPPLLISRHTRWMLSATTLMAGRIYLTLWLLSIFWGLKYYSPEFNSCVW